MHRQHVEGNRGVVDARDDFDGTKTTRFNAMVEDVRVRTCRDAAKGLMLLARCVVDGNERGVRRRRRRNATSSSRVYFIYRISVVPRLATRGQRRR